MTEGEYTAYLLGQRDLLEELVKQHPDLRGLYEKVIEDLRGMQNLDKWEETAEGDSYVVHTSLGPEEVK